ncbi:sensor domain-containing diguanylate cyclase [Vibrio salinus]|uniref:sensor domain-containing diguanylate cyclase n=1 Tax=Vibrio salinus TaxID=2899784 RepID=UPI001E55C451|nr:diguanylate cyclase [Vibrio salinus]MCE0496101.1 diguanylate cyclase [Vibrio salinus]
MVIKTGSLDSINDSQSGSLNNELLTAILTSASDLITGHGLLHGINPLLEELGRITQVSRVWIFQTLELQDDYILQDYVFEWASEEKYIQIGLPHFNHFKSAIHTLEYSDLIKSRQKGEYQHVITSKLSDSWLKTYLESQKIRSMLTIPIIVENQWWGTLGLDDCERAIEWSATEIVLLRTASFFISSAIVRDNLRVKRNQLSVLMQNTTCSTWELDIRRGHLWCTSEILSPSSDVVHTIHFNLRLWLRRIHPAYRHRFLQQARKYIYSKSSSFRCDIKILRNDGTYGWIEVSANSAIDVPQQDPVLAGIFWDITDRKEGEVRLEQEATTDPLTGVLNRRKIKQKIESYLSHIRRHQSFFTLAIVDIDYFKRINDTYGHPVGDKVLCHFTKICQKALRKNDSIARIGGEEFAILLPKTAETTALEMCHYIRDSIKNHPYIHQNKPITYSVSIGASIIRNNNLSVDKIIEQTDNALYQAKHHGRDQVVLK